MENIDIWNKNYDLARIYYEKNGNLLIPNRFKTKNGYEYDENGIYLGVWIRTQRKKYNKVIKSIITQEQIEKLNEIGMVWKIESYTAKDYFDLATEYYNHHGNLLVHKRFKTINGYDYDKSGVPLGYWIGKQRNLYPNLKKEVIDALEKIGMVWDPYETRFDNMLALATNYYEKNGDLNIPLNFKTINGYEYNNAGVALGIWLYNIRKSEVGKVTMKITNERLEKLKKIGYKKGLRSEINYDKMVELIKNYHEHYDNINIPLNFKTKDGINYDENGVFLGLWIRRQMKLIEENSISHKNLEKLKKLKFDIQIEDREQKWERLFSLATIYFNKYNNLKIPRSFKTKNGYEYDPDGLNLGIWIQVQRNNYHNNKLEYDKTKKLNEIKMIWNKREYDFYNGNITPRVKKEILKQFKDYLESIDLNMFENKEDVKRISSGFSKVLTYNKVK